MPTRSRDAAIPPYGVRFSRTLRRVRPTASGHQHQAIRPFTHDGAS
jgi:hypothetical protein